MRRHFIFSGYSFFFLLTFFLLVSCKDDDKDTKTNDVSMTEAKGPITNALTTGSLDTLYIERSAFDNIQGNVKLAFSFTFKVPDTLTLHGWIYRGNQIQYDSLPNMILKNTNASGYTYTIGTYFGNVVITVPDYARIKSALNNPAMKYVLFAPQPDGNNIMYKIFVSDKLSETKETILVVTPTGADANPSPPKNY